MRQWTARKNPTRNCRCTRIVPDFPQQRCINIFSCCPQRSGHESLARSVLDAILITSIISSLQRNVQEPTSRGLSALRSLLKPVRSHQVQLLGPSVTISPSRLELTFHLLVHVELPTCQPSTERWRTGPFLAYHSMLQTADLQFLRSLRRSSRAHKAQLC